MTDLKYQAAELLTRLAEHASALARNPDNGVLQRAVLVASEGAVELSAQLEAEKLATPQHQAAELSDEQIKLLAEEHGAPEAYGSDGWYRWTFTVAQLRSLLDDRPPGGNAAIQFNAEMNNPDSDLAQQVPLERLRYFLSLALAPQDWLDVEELLDALPKSQAPDPLDVLIAEAEATPEGRRGLEEGRAFVRAALSAPVEAQAVPEGWKLLKDSTFQERSFPEDAIHENGNYYCVCLNCGRQFTGLKRRVTCKVCAAAPTPSTKGGE